MTFSEKKKDDGTRAVTARVLSLDLLILTVLVALIFGSGMVRAEEIEDTAEPAGIDVTEDSLISLGSAAEQLEGEELGEQRAKALLEIDKVFINDQELNGTVTGNTAINSNNGANMITGDAFGNASGIVSSIQNTGNNVLIQSATIVNVSIED